MFSLISDWFSNKTFSKKILYSYLFFCVIPLLLTATISGVLFFNVTFSRTKSSITDSGNKISSLLTNKLEQYESIVNSLVREPTFICIVRDPSDIMTPYEINGYINEKMSEIKVSIPEIIDFTIYADLPYENDLFEPFKDISNDSDIFYASRQQNASWYSKNGETYVAYPISGLYDKKLLGIISLHIDMNRLVDNFTEISLDEYGVYIFNSTGEKLYSREVFPFEIGRMTKNMLDVSSDSMFTAGKYFIVTSKNVFPYGINVYCIVPKNSVTDPIVNLLYIPSAIWIICLFLVITLCYLASNTLSKRVRILESQMKNVSKGDLTVFEPEKSLDEIGNISRFCSETIAKLNKLIEDNYISKIKLQDTQNKALIAQINPHFLYNTLNLIAGQAIIAENDVISDVVVQLSDYYRTTLNKGKNLILISDEIKNVSAYCNLQLRLHDYRFSVEYDIDERVFSYQTINLCLQPLVENAIEHGILNFSGDEGFIKIIAKLVDNDVVFTIINNMAIPIEEDPQTFLNITTAGYGLKNIQSRIHIIFGEEYGISLSCKDDCFYATLRIPATDTVSEKWGK